MGRARASRHGSCSSAPRRHSPQMRRKSRTSVGWVCPVCGCGRRESMGDSHSPIVVRSPYNFTESAGMNTLSHTPTPLQVRAPSATGQGASTTSGFRCRRLEPEPGSLAPPDTLYLNLRFRHQAAREDQAATTALRWVTVNDAPSVSVSADGSTSTNTVEPSAKVPSSTAKAIRSPSSRWMTRLRGRAPKAGS